VKRGGSKYLGRPSGGKREKERGRGLFIMAYQPHMIRNTKGGRKKKGRERSYGRCIWFCCNAGGWGGEKKGGRKEQARY